MIDLWQIRCVIKKCMDWQHGDTAVVSMEFLC